MFLLYSQGFETSSRDNDREHFPDPDPIIL